MRKKVWDWILTLCCWREEEEKNAVILLAFVFGSSMLLSLPSEPTS